MTDRGWRPLPAPVPDLEGLLDGIKGFLEPAEARRLYETALTASRVGPCLEIGSYCGKSAVCIGTACRGNGGVLFSIDHHRGSEEQQPGEAYFDADLLDPATGGIDTFSWFRRAIAAAGLDDTVVPIVCDSAVAARSWATPLSLIFIDGGHSFEAVAADYRLWCRHLMPGGYLMMHDIHDDPAKGGQAPFRVYRTALASGRYRELPMTGSLGVLQRRGPSRADRPRDRTAGA